MLNPVMKTIKDQGRRNIPEGTPLASVAATVTLGHLKVEQRMRLSLEHLHSVDLFVDSGQHN